MRVKQGQPATGLSAVADKAFDVAGKLVVPVLTALSGYGLRSWQVNRHRQRESSKAAADQSATPQLDLRKQTKALEELQRGQAAQGVKLNTMQRNLALM